MNIGDIKTAVSVDSVFLMELACQRFVVGQRRTDVLDFTVEIYLNLLEKISSQASASPDRASIGSGPVEDCLPL